MAGVLLAIGLTSVGIGLPLIAAERGTWDFVGLGFLVAGVVIVVSAYLLWWQNKSTVSSTPAAEPDGPSHTNAPLHRAIANTLTELDAIQRRLIEAAKTGRLVVLPAHHYQPAADLLAERGLVESRQILDEAYNVCDHLQHRLEDPDRNWGGHPAEPEPVEPRIEEDDNLPEVLQKVEAAIAELRQRQGTLPD
jgi:hypothetical protein